MHNRLATLPCNKSGIGFTAFCKLPWDNIITLAKGQGLNFPDIVGGECFFIRIEDCGSCYSAKVVNKVGDLLYLENKNTLLCPLGADAKVTYDLTNKDAVLTAAAEVPLYTSRDLDYDEGGRKLSLVKDKCCDKEPGPTLFGWLSRGLPVKRRRLLGGLLGLNRND